MGIYIFYIFFGSGKFLKTIFMKICVLEQMDEEMKIVKVEFFLDRGELLGGLMKGGRLESGNEEVAFGCPFLKNTGWVDMINQA